MIKKYMRRRNDRNISIRQKAAEMFFTIPAAVLVMAGAVLVFQGMLLPPKILSGLSIVSYSLVIVGTAISVGFNRSRVFFGLLLLAISQIAFWLPAPGNMDEKSYQELIYYFSSIGLPFNIIVFSLMKEHGPFTPHGCRRLAFVLTQLLIMAVIIVAQDKEILAYIRQDLASPAFAFNTALPATGVVVIVLGLLLFFSRQMAKVTPVDNAFFMCLLALFAGFHFGPATSALPLFYTAASVMLTIAVIQESYSIAYLDELTGLPARRLLREEMAKLSANYSIAMVDIDYFKKVNDKYGHDVGDDVLRFIAATIASQITVEGKVFRYGGEEFAIIFPEKSLDEIMPCLEELRKTIATRQFHLRTKAKDKKIVLTVSIGVAESGGKQQTAEEVVKAADTALYRAKESGRNRVEV